MDCARNIITANFSGGGTSATTAPLWQWDYGQALCITGIEDLPAAFEVHFSTNRAGGVSTVAVGADGQVTIPNVLLTIGKNLNAWIYLSDAQGEGETEYSILIPVKARPMPETYDAEVSGEFDDVVRQVSEYAETAQTAADNAGASASAAATSADSAAASASAAESAKTAAETAQGKAEDAQTAAETAAQTATEKAQQTAQDAAQAAQSKADAESAAGRAEAAQTGAESAKTDAETAAQDAADSASAASASATSAGQAASAAAQSATEAAQSAASIEGDVQIASQKAAEAQTAAGQAVTAKEAAQTAQQGAETAETNAGQSASTATAKAAEAAQSASNAAQSKTDAEAAATRAEQAAASLTVDSALSDTSTNPVQNKVVTGEVTQLKSALDDSITKTVGKNLLNTNAAVDGYLNANGTIHANTSSQDWKTSDFINVDGQESIAFSCDNNGVRARLSVSFITIFDATKAVISQQSGNVSVFTIPDTAVYLRFSYHGAITNVMAEFGTDISNQYYPYEEYTGLVNSLYPTLEETKTALADGKFLNNESVSEKQTSFIQSVKGKNLYTGENEVDGYLNTNGTIHTNSASTDWVTTDFIGVAGMDYVTLSAYVLATNSRAKVNMYFLCVYNSEKTLIEQVSGNPKTYAVGQNVAYIRFSYRGTLYEDLQVENNSDKTGYEPYTLFNVLKNALYQSWVDKKWTVVGDSLTEVNSRTDRHYYDYISEKTGINVHIMGVGGTGYIRGQGDNNAFYQRISSVPTDSDVITIFGSLNDIGSGAELGTADDTGTTTIGGAINTTLDNLFTAYPLANVGVVTPTPWDGNGYAPIDEPNAASAYVALIKEICEKRSIPCLDLFHESLLRPWDSAFRALAYSKDEGNGVHPDENGHKLIAPRFKGFLDSLII